MSASRARGQGSLIAVNSSGIGFKVPRATGAWTDESETVTLPVTQQGETHV